MNGARPRVHPHAPDARVFGLDVLRALAVASVVFAHAGVFFPAAELRGTDIARAMFLCSHIGVEMFFVLSGFLIGRILLRDPARDAASLWRFWARRWIRTLPPYYLTLAALALIFTPGNDVLARYLALLQCARFADVPPAFFPVSWSLAVEEWFYLGLPLVLMVAGGRVRTIALLLAVATAVRWNILWDGTFFEAKYFTWLRFDALLWGVLGAALSLRAPTFWQRIRWPAGALCALGCAAIIYLFWCVPVKDPLMRGPLFTLTSVTFACALPAAAAWYARPGWLVGMVSWLAAISYPLYLVHLELMRKAAAEFGGWGAPLGIGAALAIAWAMHRLLERPLLAWRDRRVGYGSERSPS